LGDAFASVLGDASHRFLATARGICIWASLKTITPTQALRL
jgi:hypothetical protein